MNDNITLENTIQQNCINLFQKWLAIKVMGGKYER